MESHFHQVFFIRDSSSSESISNFAPPHHHRFEASRFHQAISIEVLSSSSSYFHYRSVIIYLHLAQNHKQTNPLDEHRLAIHSTLVDDMVGAYKEVRCGGFLLVFNYVAGIFILQIRKTSAEGRRLPSEKKIPNKRKSILKSYLEQTATTSLEIVIKNVSSNGR